MVQPIDPLRSQKRSRVIALFTELFPEDQFILITGAAGVQPTAATNMTVPAIQEALRDLLRQLPGDEVHAQVPPEKRDEQ
jgi:hypothetical protein